MNKWTVYVTWRNQRALYAGLTDDLPRRMRWHRYGSKWFKEITGITTQEFTDQGVAKIVEAERIGSLEPIYNRHRPSGLSRTDPRLYDRQYRTAHREKILARKRAWRAANKDKIREYSRKRDEKWYANFVAKLTAEQGHSTQNTSPQGSSLSTEDSAESS